MWTSVARASPYLQKNGVLSVTSGHKASERWPTHSHKSHLCRIVLIDESELLINESEMPARVCLVAEFSVPAACAQRARTAVGTESQPQARLAPMHL